MSFGLVNVPIGLFSATEDHTVHFSQFEQGTSDRVRNKRVNESTGEEVEYSDIVKGYDLGGGEYVIVTPEELDEVEPVRSRTIEVSDFVDQSEIDPIYYQRTYYLAPQNEEAEKPYALLLEAMDRAGRIGVGTFVMRGKEYLVAIRPAGKVLALETMYFADEIRDPAEELDRLPKKQAWKGREIDMAVSLIESMTVPFEPGKYTDSYRQRVMELVEAKRKGESVVTEGQDQPEAAVVDLMEALQRSLERSKGRRHGGDGRSAGDGLDAMSRDELYEQAKNRDVPGRSKMSREELLGALRAS